MKTTRINSSFTQDQKSHTLNKSETVMHNKEQHLQSDYYKKIGEEIKNYDRVILFGPTNAKAELINKLKEDHNFSKIRIEVKQMDKMTENQEHAFVREYFS
jgi:stalled ribosome rescue protein Dom34